MKYFYLIILFPVLLSCQNRDEKVDIELLTGFDYRIFQKTEVWELAKAVRDKDLKLIKDLINSKSVDVNFQEPKFGKTLLMMTVTYDDFNTFKELIKQGANVNIHNTYDSLSVIHYVCDYIPFNKVIKYLDVLLENGSDINDKSQKRDFNTPLLLICSKISNNLKKLKIVKYLVEHEADINYINKQNYFALNTSVIFDSFNTSLYLIKKGADYSQPFFLKENSIRKKNDYIMDVLAYSFVQLESVEYVDKMKLVNYLEEQGLKYNRLKNPNKWHLQKIKRMNPENWKEYLKVY